MFNVVLKTRQRSKLQLLTFLIHLYLKLVYIIISRIIINIVYIDRIV